MSKKSESPAAVFERDIITACDAYHAAGIAKLHKVDPPLRVLHLPGGGKRVVFLKNPYLDFTGTWTARGGKAVHFECKSTDTPQLNIRQNNDGNGIKASQLAAAIQWQTAGAAVAFLWRFRGETRILTPFMVRAQLADRQSLRWCDAHAIPQGPGFLFLDFLSVMARLTPPAS